MIIDGNHITADEGKYLKRIVNNEVVGTEYYLGYLYYLDGQLLPEPMLETPASFVEITDEDIQREKEEQYPLLVEQYIREKYTISDELALQRQRNVKQQAFDEYYAYCEECKQRARNELELNDNEQIK